ncbi:MAG: Ppx/GppA family phosphatase [Gemmatimonadaceae bacterium]|nr:Ppx/GppA family phosphatase [Gemmatimonadaceae bacterium]
MRQPARPARRTPTRSRPGDGSVRIAAVDIGSNSIRQIVADVSPEGAIRIVDEMKSMPRLGTGVMETGVLAADAMDRAVAALGRMSMLARQLGAQRVEVVATSAVRDATNGSAFLARVRRETGLQARVIDGAEEARLSFRSALAHFDLGTGRTVVMDIGGGSLELAAAAGGAIDHLASLPLGALRLTETVLRDGIDARSVRALRKHVRALLKPELSRDWHGSRLIGSGGTFTNLAAVFLAREGVTTARNVHGTDVPRRDLEHVLEWLAAMTSDERRDVPGLNPERADIIVAGLAVAAEVMARLECRALEVSRYGIREGILLEAARVVPTIADTGEARARSVEDLATRCGFEERHARIVQAHALVLFDRLGKRLGLTSDDRRLMADAALLHDVGYHISFDRHHKHSYHLIVHAELLGITPTDQVMIANVARYHRGAVPKKKHSGYGTLDRALRSRIRGMAALLRIADGFDRGHVGAVKSLAVRVVRRGADPVLRITPVAARSGDAMRLEIWGAIRKATLLADVLKMPVQIVAPDGNVVSTDAVDSAELATAS